MSEGSVISKVLYRELLERDDYACIHCNSDEGLQPAHYEARSTHPNRVEVVDDYMLLCNECHRKHTIAKLKVLRLGGRFFFREVR